MKTSLSYLPEITQDQILQVVNIIKGAANPEKIILFGSYAKGNYVQHNYIGRDGILYEYISDYDFLVVTKENKIKEYELEDIIRNKTQHYKTPINLQIHEIDYINEGLEFGQYFFEDIINEGVLLYDTEKVKFTAPRILTPEELRQVSQRYFDIWFISGKDFLEAVEFFLSKDQVKLGVFMLHQATESFYYATLLVFTGYKPKTHNLIKLRKQAKQLSENLFLVFPIESNNTEKQLFDLLKRGYIDARYKEDYKITKDELMLLADHVKKMKLIVESICMEKINSIHLKS